MLVLARPEANSLLRCLIVAVMLVAGVFVLALCADGVCPTCAHEYYGSTERPKHLLARLALGMQSAFATFFASVRPMLVSAAEAISSASPADGVGVPMRSATALRI